MRNEGSTCLVKISPGGTGFLVGNPLFSWAGLLVITRDGKETICPDASPSLAHWVEQLYSDRDHSNHNLWRTP